MCQDIGLRQFVIEEECHFQWSCSSSWHLGTCRNGVDTEHIDCSVGGIECDTDGHTIHCAKLIPSGYFNVVACGTIWCFEFDVEE